MLTYGLEKEYFVLDRKQNPILAPKELPHDECGWLAEARGKASTSITEAVFSLKAEEYRLMQKEKELGVLLVGHPVMKISRSLKIEARRIYVKGLTKYKNLYGYEHHRNTVNEATAGVHITISNPRTYFLGDKSGTYNTLFDWCSLFRHLDKQFEKEIKEAKRRPGFYEIKNSGLIEYRSLPANVNLYKIISVIHDWSS